MRNCGKAMLVALGMSALFLSCGGDDDNGSCGAFTPCGGDVVGTWTIKNMCVTGGGAGAVEDCPGATSTFEGIKGSGTITFNANMTTTENVAISGSMKMNLPASCLMGATCAQVDAGLKAAFLGDPEAPFSAVSCSGSGSCTCNVTFKGTSMMSMDTYTISGNKITDGEGEEQEYCVSGKTLNMRSSMSMAGMMDDLTFSMTLEKP
jgi:hypothetical protein